MENTDTHLASQIINVLPMISTWRKCQSDIPTQSTA